MKLLMPKYHQIPRHILIHQIPSHNLNRNFVFVTYLTGSPELLSYSPRGVKALVVYLLVVLEKKEIHIYSFLIIIG